MTRIQVRRGTSGEWALADPVLGAGEPGFDMTNWQVRFGDGVTPWSGLVVSIGGATLWADVVGKPVVFPPDAHTHAQADVTGLVSALAGKSDTGHTHTLASLGGFAPALCRIYRATNQSIPAGAGWTDVSFSNAAYEVGGDVWTSGATVTIAVTGYYQVFAEATLDGAGLLSAEVGYMQVLLNGTTTILEDERTVAIGGKPSLMGMAQRSFTAGDTLVMQVQHSRVMAIDLLAQGDHSPDIILCRVA